jgi:hypothetical protein
MQLDLRFWDGMFYDGPRPTSIGTRPVLGFRLNWYSDGGLVSLSNLGYTWKPGQNLARCRSFPTKHHAPGPACTCGLYACHDLVQLLRDVASCAASRPTEQLIIAGVAGRGVVRVHERGWRAQYARIVALCNELPVLVFRQEGGTILVGHELIRQEAAPSLGEKYGVPVVPLNDLFNAMRSVGDFAEEMP